MFNRINVSLCHSFNSMGISITLNACKKLQRDNTMFSTSMFQQTWKYRDDGIPTVTVNLPGHLVRKQYHPCAIFLGLVMGFSFNFN